MADVITNNEMMDILLNFQPTSKRNINKISVLEITNKKHILKDVLLDGGLYDSKLGPIKKGQLCGQCNATDCIGHLGHIVLPDHFLNPLFKNVIVSILNIVCHRCYTVQMDRVYVRHFISQCFLLRTCDFDRFHRLDYWTACNTEDILESQSILSCVETEMAKIKCKLFPTEIFQPERYSCKLCRSSFAYWPTPISKQLDCNDALLNLTGVDVRQQNASKATERLTDELMRKMKHFLSKKENCLNPECSGTRKVCRVTDYGLQARNMKDKWKTGAILALEAQPYRKLLRNVWKKEEMFLRQYCPVLNSSNEKHPTDMFFMKYVIVLPNPYRLPNRVGDRYYMHPRSAIYHRILIAIPKVEAVKNEKPMKEEVDEAEEEVNAEGISPEDENSESKMSYAKRRAFIFGRLQLEIDRLFDSHKQSFGGGLGLSDMKWSTKSDNTSEGGVKQMLERKDGKIRGQMMGKRANYSGRSVITPDPYIDVDEIGISLRYARELTIPVKVNHMNRYKLRELVMNGPDSYPGANFIEDNRGRLFRIPSDTDERFYEKRLEMAYRIDEEIRNGEPLKAKIVHRHLVDGDYLLVNRQPTLHKSSMLSLRAYIYKDESQTIRLNYAACKGFNADFDGDEINIHCPQDAEARSELYDLCAFHTNYLSPRDGKPIAGLIQDHVLAAVHLTREDQFFNHEHYRALVCSAFRRPPAHSMRYLPPAIIRPKIFWTGKQVFSTVLLNILLSDGDPERKLFSFESKSAISFGLPIGPFNEKHVYFANCELLVGIIDNKNIGSSLAGLIHRIQFMYGNKAWTKVLSGFSRMLTHYCKLTTFSFSANNVLLTEKSAKKRASKLGKLETVGQKIALEVLGMPEDSTIDKKQISDLLAEEFVRNPKFQQEFDKVSKRETAKLMNSLTGILSKSESLQNDSYRNQLKTMIMSGAKGKPENLLQITMAVGQIELEGKRPAFNVMGRTLPCFRPYDPNPIASGLVANSYCSELNEAEFQFVATAGREGLVDTAVKTSRSGYLQRSLIKGLENLRVNYDGTVRDCDGTVIQLQYGEDGLDCTKIEFLQYEHFDWLIQNADILLPKYYHPDKFVSIPDLDKTVHRYWKKLKKHNTEGVMNTLFHDYSPRTYFGSCSDKMLEAIERKVSELKKRKDGCGENVVEKFRNLIYSLLSASQVPPGDPVGITAAQSLGEPSTQMTLNTFHMAGNSDQNVTLGIPQLVELLQRGSRCRKNGYMEVRFRENLDNIETLSQNLLIDFRKVKLSDVLKMDGHVKYRKSVTNPDELLGLSVRMNVSREVSLKMTPKALMNFIVKNYFAKLVNCLKSRSNPNKKTGLKGRSRKRIKLDNDAGSDGDDDGDGDYNSDNEEHEIGHRNFKKYAKSAKKEMIDDMASEDEIDDNEDGDDGVKHEQEQEQEQENGNEEHSDDDSDYPGDESDNDKTDDSGSEKDDDEEESETEATMNDVDKEVKRGPELNRSSYSSKELYNFVRENYKIVQSFSYDEKKYEWFEFQLELPADGEWGNIEKTFNSVARSIVVNEMPGINNAIIYEDAEGRRVFRTEGVNFSAIMMCKNLFDLNTIYSNDVYTILTNLGIDAARTCLIREVRSVYEAYNIKIDYRHYSLIADYLLNSGRYVGFNRHGLKFCASPFQRITHETAVNNLIDCIVQDKYEKLDAVSASVLTASRMRIGTTFCKLLADNKLYERLLINRLFGNKTQYIFEMDRNTLDHSVRERTFEDDREEFMLNLFGVKSKNNTVNV